MKSVTKLFTLLCLFLGILADCDFIYTVLSEKPIFLQKFAQNYLIIPKYEKSISIPNNGEIYAYCPTKFNPQYNSYLNGQDQLTILCTNNYIQYKLGTQVINIDPSTVICNTPSYQLFEHSSKDCLKSGFLIGFTFSGIQVVFAEICFDLDLMRLEHVHYVIAKRTPVFSEQEKYNPANITDLSANISSISGSFLPSNSVIKSELIKKVGDMSLLINYEITSLIMPDLFQPYFDDVIKGYDNINSIIMWDVLKAGNWKRLQIDLKEKSYDSDLDVYTGSSGVVTYPSTGKCDYQEELKFTNRSMEAKVPLYVWTYVKSRTDRKFKDLVIIGINSPFVDNFKQSIFCKDTCAYVNWLANLNKTRKSPGLGYMFCCDPREARNFLEELHSLNIPEASNVTDELWGESRNETTLHQIE